MKASAEVNEKKQPNLLLVAPIPSMTAPHLAHCTFKVTKAKSPKTADRENGDKIILEEQENNQVTLPSTEHVIHPYRVISKCSKRLSLLEASLQGCLYHYQSGASHFRFRDCRRAAGDQQES